MWIRFLRKIDRIVLMAVPFVPNSGQCWIVVNSFLMILKMLKGNIYCFVRLVFWATLEYDFWFCRGGLDLCNL